MSLILKFKKPLMFIVGGGVNTAMLPATYIMNKIAIGWARDYFKKVTVKMIKDRHGNYKTN